MVIDLIEYSYMYIEEISFISLKRFSFSSLKINKLFDSITLRPVGQALGPLIESLSSNANAGFTVGQRFVEARIDREASPEYQLLNTAIEEARYGTPSVLRS